MPGGFGGALSGLGGLSSTYGGYQEAQSAETQNLIQQFTLDQANRQRAADKALGNYFMPGGQQMPQGVQPPQQPAQPSLQPMPGQPPAGGAWARPPQGPQQPQMPPQQPQMPPQQPQMPQRPPAMPPGSAAAGGAPSGGRPPGPPGGPPGASGGMPQMGQMFSGQGMQDLKTAAAGIARANPGIDGETLVAALHRMLPLLKPEDAFQVQQMRLWLQQQHLDNQQKDFDARQAEKKREFDIEQDRKERVLKERTEHHLTQAENERKRIFDAETFRSVQYDKGKLAERLKVIHNEAMDRIRAETSIGGMTPTLEKALKEEEAKNNEALAKLEATAMPSPDRPAGFKERFPTEPKASLKGLTAEQVERFKSIDPAKKAGVIQQLKEAGYDTSGLQ